MFRRDVNKFIFRIKLFKGIHSVERKMYLISTKHCSNIIVLLCAAEAERVQSLIRTLARTIGPFKV